MTASSRTIYAIEGFDKAPIIVSNHKLISMIVFSLSIITVGLHSLSVAWTSWLESELVLAAIAILLPWVASSIYRNTLSTFPILKQLIDLPDDEFSRWFINHLKFTFSSRAQYLIAAGLIVTGIYTTHIFLTPWTGLNQILFYCMIGILFGLAGIVGWYYLGIWLMLACLLNKEVKIDIFRWPVDAFRNLHQRYMNTFVLGVILYAGAVVGVWLSPGGGLIALNTRIGQLWIFPLAGIVITYFLSIEYFTHQLMANCKYGRVDAVQTLLRENFKTWLANPNEDRSKLTDALIAWYENIKSEQVWPLNFTAILTVVGTLLLPTFKTIFDLVVQTI